MASVAHELQQSLHFFYLAIVDVEKRNLIGRGKYQLEHMRPALPSEYPEQKPDERELWLAQSKCGELIKWDEWEQKGNGEIDLQLRKEWKKRKTGWPMLLDEAKEALTHIWQSHDRARELVFKLLPDEVSTLNDFEPSWNAKLRDLLNKIISPLSGSKNEYRSTKQGELVFNYSSFFAAELSEEWPSLVEELKKYISNLSPVIEANAIEHPMLAKRNPARMSKQARKRQKGGGKELTDKEELLAAGLRKMHDFDPESLSIGKLQACTYDDLSKETGLPKGKTMSDFFKTCFGNNAEYQKLCKDEKSLAMALAKLSREGLISMLELALEPAAPHMKQNKSN